MPVAGAFLRACCAKCGTEIAYGATRLSWRKRYPAPTPLRACYAMSGTHIAYGDILLRARYAMSDTQIA
eukprot:548155-Rhodomonas_salina.2